MARFLFVVPPLTGHVNPTVSVAAELERRGHAVAWVGHPGVVRALLPDGATLITLDDRVPSDLVERLTERAKTVRGLVGLKFLWEDFLLPLGRAMVPGVEAAVKTWRPDALVVDQQALAGGIAARRADLPWATSATTSASLVSPLDDLPKVAAWLRDAQGALSREFGLEPLEHPDRSPHGVIVFSTEALAGPAPDGERLHYVGPAIRARTDDTPFPFEALRDDVPTVLVSVGTVNLERSRRFFEVASDALRAGDVQAVFAAPEDQVPNPPPGAIVQPWVPQLKLMEHLDAVVCHAGHNTVVESLARGVPLVVAPIKDDQPVVAGQVVEAGAGLRVRFGRVSPQRLGATIRRVLEEPGFREAAQRIGRSFAEAGGARAASDVLEGLL